MSKSTTSPAEVVTLACRSWSDEDIVSGLIRRSPAAAAALYDQHGETINRRVWRMLGADPDHDEVVQKVFVQILSSLPRLKDPAKLGDWIASITHNTVRKELRSRRYRRIVALVPEIPEEAQGQVGPDKRLLLQRGLELLALLEPDDRLLFVLRFVEGAALQEIAAATCCSLATVKRRINRARDVFLARAAHEPLIAALLEDDHDR